MTEKEALFVRRKRASVHALILTVFGISAVIGGVIVILNAWLAWSGYWGTASGVTEERGRDIAMRYLFGSAYIGFGALAALVGVSTRRMIERRNRADGSAS